MSVHEQTYVRKWATAAYHHARRKLQLENQALSACDSSRAWLRAHTVGQQQPIDLTFRHRFEQTLEASHGAGSVTISERRHCAKRSIVAFPRLTESPRPATNAILSGNPLKARQWRMSLALSYGVGSGQAERRTGQITLPRFRADLGDRPTDAKMPRKRKR
jgi:hypothetical protein